ncbi:MAG: substrate-binding domain-containing protein, partial [Bradyrhizobium sp.]|uniref:substrate-binding domain-containing protein n=1 Tax=Bradyrhizobium sp. TaxID=376 RepID=UPI002383B9B0
MSAFAAHATVTIRVAAEASLAGPVSDIIIQFQRDHAASGYMVTATFGSSSQIESQINGTCSSCTPNQPGYDLFLAADVSRPNDLIANHSSSVVAYNSPATPAKYLIEYAIGALDLWTNTAGIDVSGGLPAGWSKVAIATPGSTPYGDAAQQVLSNVYGVALPSAKVDQYPNMTATLKVVRTGSPPSEQYGFVARAQICTHGDTTPVYSGVSHQDIASGGSTYSPILQGGVEVANTRTADQQTELTAFVQYLTGKNFSGGAVTPNGANRL